MFGRNYETNYSDEEKSLFLMIVGSALMNNTVYMHRSNFPYNTFEEKGETKIVQTLHYTIRYTSNNAANKSHIEALKRAWESRGFTIQENKPEKRSISEYDHFHAVKIIQYIG